jgi:peptidoglycan/xylan/chitin deacetylase (PgdA/CDA1 family)
VIPALLGGVSIASLAAFGVYHRNSPLFGRALARLPQTGRDVALTFDDGPNPVTTPRVLDILKAEGVVATFFLLGKHVDRWPELARRVADEGHVLGNHGYHHRKLHVRGPVYVRDDLSRGTESIRLATGRAPLLFRAPHGFRNPWVSSIARSMGQRTVGWTLGVWDSARPGAAAIAQRAIHGVRSGTVLLLHDGDGYDADGDRTQTADALPVIIRDLRAQGYRFVGVPT